MPRRRYERREPTHDWQQIQPLLKEPGRWNSPGRYLSRCAYSWLPPGAALTVLCGMATGRPPL